MKQLKDIIIEKLRLDKNVKGSPYTCQPETKFELRNIIKERLEQNKDDDLNDIDVSKITDMSNLFNGLDPHNIKIDKWDVSNVIYMYNMFDECKNFEGIGLENWNVSKVIYMDGMFYRCVKFNADLSNWDVSKVKNMNYMFDYCTSLKKIPDWYKK